MLKLVNHIFILFEWVLRNYFFRSATCESENLKVWPFRYRYYVWTSWAMLKLVNHMFNLLKWVLRNCFFRSATCESENSKVWPFRYRYYVWTSWTIFKLVNHIFNLLKWVLINCFLDRLQVRVRIQSSDLFVIDTMF